MILFVESWNIFLHGLLLRLWSSSFCVCWDFKFNLVFVLVGLGSELWVFEVAILYLKFHYMLDCYFS